jgi:hypothetical protein
MTFIYPISIHTDGLVKGCACLGMEECASLKTL